MLSLACRSAPRPYTVDRGAARRRFVPVEVARDRIIRRQVGLRPFRRSGFRLEAEPLADKLLIHNYGHGGGGVTLSWGTAELAVAMLSEADRPGPVAVLGCGVVGLSTASLLQRMGREVTIYAREVPPNTTSDMSGASWYPSLVVDRERRTPSFTARLHRAARLSHRHFQRLTGPRYGVRWIEQYYLTDERSDPSRDYAALSYLYPSQAVLGPGEHPFPMRWALRDSTMLIDIPVYMPRLLEDFRIAGGRLVVRELRAVQEVVDLPERIVFNCTGLGARELFGDTEMLPVKGQLTVLLPQPEVDYVVLGDFHYMFPRRDGILLGGTQERGVETLEPNLEAEKEILAWHDGVFGGMRSE